MGTAGKVGVATAILAGGYLASRVLGLVRSMVLGATFGAGPELDAYFAAFRIPDLIFQLLAGAAMGSAFVPTFSAYLAKDEDDAWALASSVLSLIMLLLAGCAILGFLAAPLLVPLLVPGFPPETTELTIRLTRIMLISPVLFGVSGIITGILNARHHFLLPSLAPLAYNAAIILGTVLFAPSWGVFGPAWGVVLGAALHLAIQSLGLPFHRLRGVLSPSLAHPGVREVARLTGPRVLGLATLHGNQVVVTMLASGLAAGSVGALNYGWAVMMVPMGIFGMALATALFPTLAELAAADRMDDLRRAVAEGTRYLLFLNIPAGVGLIVLAEPLVRLLFQRGEFSPEAVRATALAVAAFGTGLFAYAALEVITRGYYALRDTVTPLWFGALALALNVVFGLILMGPLGHTGLALGMALSTIVEFLGMYEVLRRRLHGLHTPELLASAGRTAAASAAMAAVLLLLRGLLGDASSTLGLALQVLGSGLLGGLVFLAVSLMLGSAEATSLLERLGRLRRRTVEPAPRVEQERLAG